MLMTFILNLFILSIIGIIIIGTVIPFNSYARVQLETINADVGAALSQGSMVDLSYNMIHTVLSSLSPLDGDIEYVINIPLIYNNDGKNETVIFFSLSEGLSELFQLNKSDIVGSAELSTGRINVTSVDNPFNFTINLNKIQNLGFEYESFNQIIYLINRVYHPISFSPFIVGNISLGNLIYESLNLSSNSLFAEIVVYFKEGWTKRLSIDELNQFIVEQEKQIFQELVTGGIIPDLIQFDSHAKYVLRHLSYKIEDQTIFIQALSIPNIIIALILIFILEFGAYGLIQKEGKIYWSRGISQFKLKILYWSLEVFIDLLGLFFVQTVFSLIILIFGLQNYLHSYLFLTFSILTVVFILVKIYRFTRIDKENFTIGKAKKTAETKIKHTKRKWNYKTTRNIVFILLSIAILLQIFRIFEPLFWYPLFSGGLGRAWNWITYLISILLFGYLVFSVGKLTITSELTYNLVHLVKRLFRTGLKKLRIQRIASTALFGLIIFLVIFETSTSSYEKNRFINENQFNDVTFFDKLLYGFDLQNITNLKETFPQIKETYPIQYGPCYIIDKTKDTYAQLTAVNGSKYANKDFSWNHIIGSTHPREINELLMNFSQNSIIINQKAAEITGLRVGDSISIIYEIYLKSVPGYISSKIDNLTIVAVVDTLPFSKAFGHNNPHVYFDISHVLDIMEDEGFEKLINEFGVDLFFDDNSTKAEKQNSIDSLISLIIYELGISSTNLDIDSKYVTEEIEKDVAVPLFIAFNIVFAILFLPLFVIVFSRTAVKSATLSIRQLISRGFPTKKLRNIYAKEIYFSLLTSILMGVSIGFLLGITIVKQNHPWMLLATDFQLHVQILIRLSAIIIGGLLSSLAVIPITIRPISRLIQKIEKEKLAYETD